MGFETRSTFLLELRLRYSVKEKNELSSKNINQEKLLSLKKKQETKEKLKEEKRLTKLQIKEERKIRIIGRLSIIVGSNKRGDIVVREGDKLINLVKS